MTSSLISETIIQTDTGPVKLDMDFWEDLRDMFTYFFETLTVEQMDKLSDLTLSAFLIEYIYTINIYVREKNIKLLKRIQNLPSFKHVYDLIKTIYQTYNLYSKQIIKKYNAWWKYVIQKQKENEVGRTRNGGGGGGSRSTISGGVSSSSNSSTSRGDRGIINTTSRGGGGSSREDGEKSLFQTLQQRDLKMLFQSFMDKNYSHDFSTLETTIADKFIKDVLEGSQMMRSTIKSMIFKYRWKKVMIEDSYMDIYSQDIINFIKRWTQFNSEQGTRALQELRKRKLLQMTQITKQILDPTYQLEARILQQIKQESPQQPHTIKMAMAMIKSVLKTQELDTLSEFLKEFLREDKIASKYPDLTLSDLYRKLLTEITLLNNGQHKDFQSLMGGLTHQQQVLHRSTKVDRVKSTSRE
jgi:hypothetical protein